ncbi:crossover junction endodeoxyribonuclease RuvC, partial [Natronomonas sp.]|uniref:crossover junction endodeoxyribonuclease RuvC n=1 Tax=Natronomonas sp. TaxID=2184060 RepID=UPI0039759905
MSGDTSIVIDNGERCTKRRRQTCGVISVHARGVLMLAAQEKRCPVFEYPATIVKKSLTGAGSATKEQVKYMVLKMLSHLAAHQVVDDGDALVG